jgi:signal transduction histidine kinase
MANSYQISALVLTALLLPAFGYLYRRFQDTRTLLWFLGFLFAMVRMLLHYSLGPWPAYDGAHPWAAAASQTSIQVSSALFLASLSPLRFRVGRFGILYVIPFAIPLVVYSILFEGVFRGITPHGPAFLVFPALGLLSMVVGLFWGTAKGPANSMPLWVGFPASALLGSLGLWICLRLGAGWPLTFVECACHFMTALLLIFAFRRFSPGMVLSVLGFSAWSLTILEASPWFVPDSTPDTILVRFLVMGKVVAAMGMILLALEDQLALNNAAQARDRRARLEIEAYTNLILSRRRVEDFDHQAAEICQAVIDNSRFAQAALLLQTAGRFRLAGAAGFDPATVKALDSLAARLPGAEFLAPGSAPAAADHCQTVSLDLSPWLAPGDDLKRLRFTQALAVPLSSRSGTEGALLLSGLRTPADPLHADDLLPAEMLTTRLQSVRSQTIMLEKLIDSEKFAGLGQLAGNVTQQLNNPLTVILGYASLLEQNSELDSQERRGVETILSEARRMRATLESLNRVSRSHGDLLAAVSVAELLADLDELHRSDFLHRSIELRLNVAPALPRARCHPHQLRQALLHCLQFATDAIENYSPDPALAGAEERTIRLEATAEGNHVQILVAHSGPGFPNPERAFDPFVPAQAGGETAVLGLSLCATILRDNNGRASAINLEPHGAAIILELQAA